MGTLKNRLNETVLLSTQNTFKLLDKKIIAILAKFLCLTGPTNYLREDASLLLPLQTWQLSYFKKVVSLCRIPLDGFQELPYAYKAIRFIANGVTDDLLSSWLIILGNIGTYRKKAQETVTEP